MSVATTGLDRIAAAFAGHGKRAAMMPYLMGGYPDLKVSAEAGLAAADAGADLIELGAPFSDPLADGPVIHAAATEALAGGVTLHGVLGVCEQIAARLPVVLMVYTNVVLTTGAERFALRAASAGASGLIVPDLPHDEAGEVRTACDAEGLALVPLVAPTSTPERIAEIGAGPGANGGGDRRRRRCREPSRARGGRGRGGGGRRGRRGVRCGAALTRRWKRGARKRPTPSAPPAAT